ncbi:hypothetical protein BZG36_00394 [Bifiguratus adelaidae]|uniref:Mitochondrial import inner membrane translocase subunit TIM21 n=1 Tax=Bifiguratus adelaidae TaxID=1938954 RepID=A0A261Y7V2_9FUNG|nr:hypothetical protein BZG36_00394 [Bifiguratus adelaidae]
MNTASRAIYKSAGTRQRLILNGSRTISRQLRPIRALRTTSKCGQENTEREVRSRAGPAAHDNGNGHRNRTGIVGMEGRKQWSELTTVVESTKATANVSIIALGVGLLGALSYLVFTELFSSNSHTHIYSDALDRIRSNMDVKARLGAPIKDYAQPDDGKLRRRRRIIYRVYKDQLGREHLFMRVYLEGSDADGVAAMEMVKNRRKNWEYKYLYVDVPGEGLPSQRVFVEYNPNAGQDDQGQIETQRQEGQSENSQDQSSPLEKLTNKAAPVLETVFSGTTAAFDLAAPYVMSDVDMTDLFFGSNGQEHLLNIPDARVTTCWWEEEKTLYYQMQVRGFCITRRNDNGMVNGTKLLNLAQLSRGKRDAALKHVHGRRVQKTGPMHLKGVWIPLAQAVEFAHMYDLYSVLEPILTMESCPSLIDSGTASPNTLEMPTPLWLE